MSQSHQPSQPQWQCHLPRRAPPTWAPPSPEHPDSLGLPYTAPNSGGLAAFSLRLVSAVQTNDDIHRTLKGINLKYSCLQAPHGFCQCLHSLKASYGLRWFNLKKTEVLEQLIDLRPKRTRGHAIHAQGTPDGRTGSDSPARRPHPAARGEANAGALRGSHPTLRGIAKHDQKFNLSIGFHVIFFLSETGGELV